jgi:hypothetical protein
LVGGLCFWFEGRALSLGLKALIDAMPVDMFANVPVAFLAVAAKIGYASVPIDLILVGAVNAAWHWFFTFYMKWWSFW